MCMEKAAKWLVFFLSFIGILAMQLTAAAQEPVDDGADTSYNLPPAGLSVPQEPYQMTAYNEKYSLYTNGETGDFALQENNTGYVWYSGQWDVLDPDHPASANTTGRNKTDLVSLLAVNYIQTSVVAKSAAPAYQNSYSYSVRSKAFTMESIENGYRITFSFPDIQASVPLEITLHEDGLRATIIGKEIRMEGDYTITSIELLPGFMAADDRQEGYIFVPSGSGALLPLNAGRGDYADYEEMVYGIDGAIKQSEYTGVSKDIVLPVCGIQADERAMTAIITQGDANAKICAQSNGSTMGYSRIYTEYVTAIVDSTTMFEADYANKRTIYGVEKRENLTDFQVLFIPLEEGKTGYSGMAAVYRQYLLSAGGLKSSPQPPSLNVTLYGAGRRKSFFLGIPYTKDFALTTFSQAEEIIADLKANGVQELTLQYQGWDSTGLENQKLPVKAKPSSVLGGQSDYASLLAYLEREQVASYMNVDFLRFQKSGNSYSILSDTVKDIFHVRTPQYVYMRSVFVPVLNQSPWYLLKPSLLPDLAEQFSSNYGGTPGLSLAGVGEYLYSDFNEAGSIRDATIEKYRLATDVFGETPLAVAVGNSYSYAFADRIFEVPQTNDGNLLFSNSVPFVHMVLHGYLPYTSEDLNRATDFNRALLQCVETGSEPYFCGMYLAGSQLKETTWNTLYSSTYSLWGEKAAMAYKTYSDVYNRLYSQSIVKHEILEQDITKTTFEDGTAIIVNYRKTSVLVAGETIEAEAFKVLEG